MTTKQDEVTIYLDDQCSVGFVVRISTLRKLLRYIADRIEDDTSLSADDVINELVNHQAAEKI
jgi:hypothetical protein